MITELKPSTPFDVLIPLQSPLNDDLANVGSHSHSLAASFPSSVALNCTDSITSIKAQLSCACACFAQMTVAVW